MVKLNAVNQSTTLISFLGILIEDRHKAEVSTKLKGYKYSGKA